MANSWPHECKHLQNELFFVQDARELRVLITCFISQEGESGARVNQPVHWFLGGNGLRIQQGKSTSIISHEYKHLQNELFSAQDARELRVLITCFIS